MDENGHSVVLAPFVEVIIGDQNLTIPPNYITGFEYTDTAANTGDAFTLDMFDKTFGFLDVLLAFNVQLAQRQKMKFRWGYHNNMSAYHYAEILAVQPGDITNAGVHVHLEGSDRGTSQPSSQTRRTKTWKGPISRIARDIAEQKEHQWDYDIEATISLNEKESRTTNAEEKKFFQDNQTDIQFLRSLSGKAKSAERKNAGDYKVYFDASVEPPILHFHPSRAIREKPKIYVVNTSRLGVVKSFAPEFQGDALYAEGKSALVVSYRDRQTKEIKTVTRKAEEFEGAPVDAKYVPVETGHTSKIDLSSVTYEEAVAYLDAYYSRLSNMVMNATLTIEGDPSVKPDSYIDILVLTPYGKKYFTSGVYYVSEVKHTISPGSYETVLTLMKNSLDVGDVKNEKAPAVSTVKTTRIHN